MNYQKIYAQDKGKGAKRNGRMPLSSENTGGRIMEKRMFKVYAKGDEKIQLKIIPGHFVTLFKPVISTGIDGVAFLT